MFDFDFEDFFNLLIVIVVVLCLIGFGGCLVLLLKYLVEYNVLLGLFIGLIVTSASIVVVILFVAILKELF